MTDIDGVERLDAIDNFTALIHGHAFAPVVEPVSPQLARGTAFSASTPKEVALLGGPRVRHERGTAPAPVGRHAR